MPSMFVLVFVSCFFWGVVVVYYNDTPIGADRINNEVKQVFSPGCSTSSSCSSSMLFIIFSLQGRLYHSQHFIIQKLLHHHPLQLLMFCIE